jgi:hypothetical protein
MQTVVISVLQVFYVPIVMVELHNRKSDLNLYQGKCVIRDSPHKKLKEVMAERLFGQDHVIEPMSQMVESWYKRNSIKGNPTVLSSTTCKVQNSQKVNFSHFTSLVTMVLAKHTPSLF